MTAGSDAFADAPLLSAVQNYTVHAVGPSATATTEPGEPLEGPVDRTRWLKFVPAVTGRFGYVLPTGAASSWRRVTLFSGDGTIGGLVQRAYAWSQNSSTWSVLNYVMTAGETYWLQIGTEVGQPDSDYGLTLTFHRQIQTVTDWEQSPDFVREVARISVPTGLVTTNKYGRHETIGTPGGYEEGRFKYAQEDALIRDGMTIYSTLGMNGLLNVQHGHVLDPTGPTDESNYFAWSQAAAAYFTAWNRRAAPGVPTPPGYTTTEWEGGSSVSTILSADLVASVKNTSDDFSVGGAVADGEWETKIVAADTVVWGLPPDLVTTQEYPDTHDMSSDTGAVIASFGPGRVREVDATWTEMTFDVTALLGTYGRLAIMWYVEKTGFIPPTPAALTPNATKLEIDLSVSAPRLMMTMRPPRHRFAATSYEVYLGGEGRLLVDVGGADAREWKYMNPLPGENGGFGVGYIRDEDGSWVPLSTKHLLIDLADPGDDARDWSGRGWQ